MNVQRCIINVLLISGSAQAATLTWDNGFGSGIWDASTANWTGSLWSNANPDDAIFNAVGGVVTLDPGITAGSVSVGNTGGNFANLSLSGGSLNASSLTVQGSGGNGGAYGSNPTLTVNSTVSISGDAGVGRSNLDIAGGSFTANRIISSAGSADWGRLVISGGTVTATNGIDGSVNTSATFQIDLNGGTLYTPSIHVADRELGANNDAWLTFNGGTLKPTADTTTFITTYGGGSNAYISNGGAIIDTDGHDISIGTILRNSAGHSGPLTKNGAGTLTLTWNTGGTISTYGGATTVNEGILELQGGTAWILMGGSAVTVNSGATLQGNDSLANQLNGLTLNNGTVSASGVGNGDWGNFHLTGNVTATGASSMDADIALRATNVDFSVAGGGTLNVGGVLHNGHLFGQNAGSPATVSKSGDGVMVLSGNNTYGGATTVTGGTLLIDGTHTGGGLITVDAGATLGGNGTVGNVEVADGGILSPGASAGHLTVNDLTLNPASVLNIELGAPTLVQDPGSDFVTVNNMLTLGGTLNILALPGFGTPVGGESWLVMTAANGIADNGIVIGSTPALPGGLSFALEYSSGVDVFLNVVPEAGTAGLFGLALLVLRRVRGVKTFRTGQ